MRCKPKRLDFSFAVSPGPGGFLERPLALGMGIVFVVWLLAATATAQDLSSTNIVLNSPETYQLGHSPLNEPAGRAKTAESAPSSFAIPVGSGGFNFNAGLKMEYVDNVYLTQDNRSDDFILVPEFDVAAFFPVGQFNSLNLDVGLAYYEYLRNTKLNTGVPLVNPNTDLAFTLRSGDFKFKFSEAFSFQQSPLYETGSEFYNLFNTALFERYLNRVGCLATWDQHDLVMTAGYFHENLWAESSIYNYIDHSSELFSADAMLATSPKLTLGLEAAGSINDFYNQASYDTWRARVGPAVRINPSPFIKIRMGIGYERIQYDSAQALSLGLTPENTYYAYADIEHQLTRFFRHSLTLSHDNQLGFNAANLEGTTLSYSLTWNPRKMLSITPLASINFYDESFGSGSASLFHERFTFYYAGIAARYQLGRHWRAGASWYYRLKDSEIRIDGYAQNQVSIEVLYQF
jgi:hypothetical protein